MVGMNDQIREAIRVQMARKDMTQAKLAEKAGVSKQYIHKLVRGKTGNLSESWTKILDALELRLSVESNPKEVNLMNQQTLDNIGKVKKRISQLKGFIDLYKDQPSRVNPLREELRVNQALLRQLENEAGLS